MSFYRAYKSSDQGVAYREAWIDEDTQEFLVHHGDVGRLGETTEQKFTVEEEAAELLEIFIQQCTADGYSNVEDLDLGQIKVTWKLKTTEGTQRDRSLAVKARHTLSAHLAWRGLGEILNPEEPHIGGGELSYIIDTPAPRKAIDAVLSACREHKLDPTKVSATVTKKAELN